MKRYKLLFLVMTTLIYSLSANAQKSAVLAAILPARIDYTYHTALNRYLPDSKDLNLLVKLLGQRTSIQTISEYSDYSQQ